MHKSKSGFTIVELLIVIVVIAILAAISIVAYNGIQDRATYTARMSDLTAIKKTLEAYRAANDTYPVTGTTTSQGWRYQCQQSTINGFIPDLQSITTTIPRAPCSDATLTNDTYLYASDGVGYKLLYIRPAMPDGAKSQIPTSMRDPVRWSGSSTWGFWTSDWSSI